MAIDNQQPSKTFRIIGPIDIALVAALCTAVFLFFPAFRSMLPETAVIWVDNSVVARYPLSEDRVFRVRGRESDLVLEIRDRGVRVVSAPCERKVCMRAGVIRMPGRQIVCAPGHVIVEIESRRNDGERPDGIVR